MRSIKTGKPIPSIAGIVVPIAVGLTVAQSIAAVFVYRSNLQLHAALSAIENAGYLPVPNPIVAATLTSLGPAVWGGLFFTLSIGTGLTLVTWAALRIRNRLRRRRSLATIVIGAGWLTILILVNLNGPVLFPSLFCLLVPLATGWSTARLNGGGEALPIGRSMVPVGILVVLTALWSTQLDSRLFVSIRDHVLLSNTIGRSVNDFYYRYTLYAAEAFKTFHQKTLKTARIDASQHPYPLERRLAAHDVIPVRRAAGTDITFVLRSAALSLKSGNRTVIETTLDQFLRSPAQSLRAFSRATDRFAIFRKLTLVGLMVGFPALLFILVYSGIKAVLSIFLGEAGSVFWASMICLMTGVLLFVPMLRAHPRIDSPDALARALDDTHWTRRVAALRYIHDHEIDITRYPQSSALVESPLVVERYWMARALAHSRTPGAYAQLVRLARDPHPNVVCQAYYALGRSGRTAAIDLILKQSARSDHWYTQWYGYGALKRLGWHQKRSR